MHWDVGIDLGTQSVRVCTRRQAGVFETASALAFREGRDTPVFGGDMARELEGRLCEGMRIETPLRDGVLENNQIAERLFRWLFRFTGLSGQRRLSVLLTCAPTARPVQREALLLALQSAGAATARLVRSDYAHALGAGLRLSGPEASLLVDVGAGKCTATLFTLSRVAAFAAMPYGLDRVDARILHAVRAHSGYRIGRRGAEEIKRTLGSALPASAPRDVIMHMTGFSIADRLPGSFDVETAPVLEACEDVVRELTGLCALVVDDCPEELAADLNDAGATLSGGGAELSGLDKRVGDALGIPCRVADVPGQSAVRGLAMLLEDADAHPGAFLGQ